MPRIRKWTNEQMAQAVKENFSMRAVLKQIGLRPTGGNHVSIKRIIEKLGLDIKHWTGRGHLRGKRPYNWKKGKPFSEIMTIDSSYSRPYLKKRLLRDGLIENRCSICSQEPIWAGEPLTMILDHINGTNNDNRRENLRLLCPNCNSQTKTFSGRNMVANRIPKEKKICSGCGKILTATRKTGMCVRCFNGRLKNKIEHPDSLIRDVKSFGIRGAARKYGVTHTTIGRWVKNTSVA